MTEQKSDDLRMGALYIRVSTHEQDELSPDAQKRLLLDYAKSNGIVVQKDAVFVESVSGRNVKKRKEFQRMIAQAKSPEHPYDVILVWKFSRFARNQEESIVYKSMLKKDHVDVISVSEPVIDGPFGSLIERIIEWMDEYYSIRLSGEVLRCMGEKALKQGYQISPPLGYDAVGDGKPYKINERNSKLSLTSCPSMMITARTPLPLPENVMIWATGPSGEICLNGAILTISCAIPFMPAL